MHQFFRRVERWSAHHVASPDHVSAGQPTGPCLVVAHAGCMQVWQWLSSQRPWPTDAAQWLKPPAYGACWSWPSSAFAPLNTAP
ncbi:MAG: hypothetical protein QM749_11670 [Aquabacterium sp.]